MNMDERGAENTPAMAGTKSLNHFLHFFSENWKRCKTSRLHISVLLGSLASDIQLLKPLINEIYSLREDVKELREAGMAYRTAPSDEPTGAESCVVRYALPTPADNMRIAQDNLSNSEMLRRLHGCGPPFTAITDVKYRQLNETNENSGRSPCLLFTVKD